MAILEMQHISKAFGGVIALSDVHLAVEAGEIHALLGENGAGKSTLMNILTGVIPADAGEILFDGKRYPNPTISIMERAGIAFVHQEVNVVNDLCVFENIFLNRERKTGFGLLNRKQMIREAERLFERLGVEIDPCAMVSELKTSQKQLLEISRALHANAKLLILDEPTTALSTQEVEHLFGILCKLKTQGHAFIFISHKMPEIFELADRFTVLRNGMFISAGRIADTTPHRIATDMVGEQYLDKDYYVPRALGETIVELRNVTGHGFSDVSLEIKKGEIVAFTGLAGCGASEVMQTMFGVLAFEGGSIRVEGKSLRGGIPHFMKSKLAMLPSNRKENSVVPDMDILDNICIAEHALSKNRQMIRKKRELSRYDEMKQLLWIKAESPKNSILSLSGGNQQKVFLARWLNTKADVLLLDNPTQGVDVGAKAEIYRLILEFAARGMTVVINTLEIPEIKKVSDRCVVFFEGRVTKVFHHDEINEHDVMLYATNAINTRGGANHAG
jgi:ribose transport system ATP-binding protein